MMLGMTMVWASLTPTIVLTDRFVVVGAGRWPSDGCQRAGDLRDLGEDVQVDQAIFIDVRLNLQLHAHVPVVEICDRVAR